MVVRRTFGRDLRVAERYDLLLCPGVLSTAGGHDMVCRLCVRLSSRWPLQAQRVSAVARQHLYDPGRLVDDRCHMLILGHPDEVR